MNKERIFILEDDPNMVIIYKRLFKNHYFIDIATNFKEAVSLLEDNYEYDLYIIDIFINNSKFNGLDLANLISSENIIIHTCLDLRLSINHTHKQYKYLQKPLNPDQNLLTIVNEFFKNENK